MEEHPYGLPDPRQAAAYHHQGVTGPSVYHHVQHMHAAPVYHHALIPTGYQDHHAQELHANFGEVEQGVGVGNDGGLVHVEEVVDASGYGNVDPQDGQPLVKPNFVSINLRAFNLYAARIRQQVRAEHPEFSGQEIERAIGQRWSGCHPTEREEFLEAARKERELLVKHGIVDPNTPSKKKRRKREEESDPEQAMLQLAGKRKRGRPSKVDTLARQAMILAAQTGIPITDPSNIAGYLASHGHPMEGLEPAKKGGRKKKGALCGSVQGNLIGQNVHGVLDGTFDAGYFVTIRVGNSDTILRGVVFAPGVAVPLTKGNDAAPGVGKMERTPGVKFPTHPAPAPVAQTMAQGMSQTMTPGMTQNMPQGMAQNMQAHMLPNSMAHQPSTSAGVMSMSQASQGP